MEGLLQVADAEAEAKDNYKYLQTLQASYEALYKGSLRDIIGALPSILGSFHTMHTMARWGIICRILECMLLLRLSAQEPMCGKRLLSALAPAHKCIAIPCWLSCIT